VDTNGIITTVAGNGIAAYSGDGGPAVQASLNGLTYIAVDASANFYMSDRYNDCVRKVDTDGIITTFAGNGVCSYSGDGSPATQASLCAPLGIKADVTGNVYIADGNLRIRKVDSSGIITTFAGNGARPYTDEYTGDGGPATDAGVGCPNGVAIDSIGNIYISHNTSHWGGYVRRVRSKPLANFTASPTRGTHPLTVSFTNTTSGGSGITYLWNFGDGTTSTDVNPMHTYSTKGIYTVTLTATGPSGLPEDSTSKVQTDIICSGYVFSADSATATTAPFTRSFGLGSMLYGRVWATIADVDYTQLKNAKLKVTDRLGNVVADVMADEGNGNISGSLALNPSVLIPGSGTVSFSIRDRAGKEYMATENIILN
jgi:hypothetical protein